MEEKGKEKDFKEIRRKVFKAGLATLGGVGLLSLLRKDAEACFTCYPGCSPQCLSCQGGNSNAEQK
jgi:hypothetical protein